MTNTSNKLRLGTRDSLLAVAQSRQVAEQLMQLHPDLHVELVTFSSRGDRDLQTPLSQVNDQQFFSDELDQALAAGDVDFCVHSWKDIDGPRPKSFFRAAVPARAFPHDALLFREDIVEVLERGRPLRIGTCSERRKINTADFLGWALPRVGPASQYEFHSLRGPVHERLARINAAAGNGRLDGVVLALAGLERLWSDTAGRVAIDSLLTSARWMIMPLSECPAAAAQGALAVETLRGNERCAALLRVLHDTETEKLVSVEHDLLREFASGNTGFGATAVSNPVLGYVARLRGRAASNTGPVYANRTAMHKQAPAAARAWSAQSWRQSTRKRKLAIPPVTAAAVFIAHADAVSAATNFSSSRLWTSGPQSWARLAQQGLWVEGCADNLGFDAVKPLLSAPVLQLPPAHEWLALTHTTAVDSWSDSGVGKAIGTYTIDVNIDPQIAEQELRNCDHFYWSSARQYAMLKNYLPPEAQHACGAGKTYRALRAAGVANLQPFASRQEWQQWLA